MLRIVANNHKDWVRLVQSMGGKEYSEDIVQEMYIKLNKYASPEKYIRNGKPNKGYIYFTLKSILYTYFKEKKKITKMPETCLNNIECTYEEVKISAEQRLSEKIEAEIKTWHWYDQAIFNWYRNEGISFRKMSAITKISWVALFGTVKRCKNRLRKSVGDDYLDYINKDYELIK